MKKYASASMLLPKQLTLYPGKLNIAFYCCSHIDQHFALLIVKKTAVPSQFMTPVKNQCN